MFHNDYFIVVPSLKLTPKVSTRTLRMEKWEAKSLVDELLSRECTDIHLTFDNVMDVQKVGTIF